MTTLRIICIALLLHMLPLVVFGQSSNYYAWSINSSELFNGKLPVQAGVSKTIKFNVTVIRSPGSAVDFKFKLRRLPQSSTDSYEISSQFNVTTADFSSGSTSVTKEFNLSVKGANGVSSTTGPDLRNNDEILMFISDASSPSGYYVPNTSFFVTLTAASGTFALPNSNGYPSNLTAVAVSSTQVLIKWKDNSNNESRFKIQAFISGTTTSTTRTVPANTSQYVIAGLAPNTHYLIYLWAVLDFNGEYGAPENVFPITFEDLCPDVLTLTSASLNIYDRKAATSIIIGNGFVLDPIAPVTFTAGQLITFSSSTIIKIGSAFKATIVSCDGSPSGMSAASMTSNEDKPSFTEDIFIYPNPSKGIVTVYLKDKFSAKGELYLIDKFSRKVYSQVVPEGSDQIQLDLSFLDRDTYYLHVISGNKKKTARMILNHN
jgi:hypothetical protein